jgi:2-polyprenyl-3-methyl-5-hydroxy-6-metoxy-1,4-benzoquinol methylase
MRLNTHVTLATRDRDMTEPNVDRRTHWDSVYAAKRTDDVSWFQARPELSLGLIRRAAPRKDAAVIDIGAGSSTLVDCLHAGGYADLTVLDIADAALDHSRARLGAPAQDVTWIAADVTSWRPDRTYDVWHDRATLHFLTAPRDQVLYADALHAALKPGGYAIIGGFAPDGPTKCSGLDTVQHDAESLQTLLGPCFALLETHGETHLTPQGREQAFRFHIFQRRR